MGQIVARKGRNRRVQNLQILQLRERQGPLEREAHPPLTGLAEVASGGLPTPESAAIAGSGALGALEAALDSKPPLLARKKINYRNLLPGKAEQLRNRLMEDLRR